LANTFRTAKGGKIIAWNDDAPGVDGTTGAHSKGVIYYNEKTDTGIDARLMGVLKIFD
jgi:hypothetical protein